MSLAAAAIFAPAVCLAQAPPTPATPVAPKVEQLDPNACGQSGADTTIGQGGGLDLQKPPDRSLSEHLARAEGVICPPAHVDPEIKAPTPPGGPMPVIPPPGSPGGDPTVQPK
ncbi:MAG: hypothetical protein K9G60_10115 [Pseudolabrys sp.]|nr:hypothetical protein [Pseudolabrys sp.]